METKRKKAEELFKQGYNCAQAVLGAFAEETGLTEKQAMMLASSFGGGMGRLREVCGAVSAMFMVLGIKEGYYLPDDQEGKKEQYKKVQEFAEKFKKENKTILCKELLENVKTTNGSEPEKRTEEYYHHRPCEKFVGDAAEIVENYLKGC